MQTENALPLARSEGLIIQALGDELLVYDLERHRSHCLNQTSAIIWKHCDGQTQIAQMCRLLEKEISAPVTEQVVWLGLKQLAGAHLLQEKLASSAGLKSQPRRELIRKIGLAAAASLPLILTINAPTAQAQASCVPRGGACTLNTQCCSGNCRGNNTCA
jgi:Coenzyme PQQ synthesis protein D (PqqD)